MRLRQPVNIKKTLLLALFVFGVPLFLSAKAYAASCTVGFMCGYNTGGYNGSDVPRLIWTDNPGHNFGSFNPTVRPGQRLNFQIGYNSATATPGYTSASWISIRDGDVISSINGAHYANLNNCANVRAQDPATDPALPYVWPTSPYYNVAWQTTSGGAWTCDAITNYKAGMASTWLGDANSPGAYAAWFGGAGGSAMWGFSIDIAPTVSTATTFCFRNHVSIQAGADATPAALAKVMAVGGADSNRGGNVCFNVVPDYPPIGDIRNVTCFGVELLAYDRNTSGTPISTPYSVWRYKYSNGVWDNPMGNNASNAGNWFNYPIDQVDHFVQSPMMRYDVYVLNIETNAWVLVASKNFTNSCNHIPAGDITANCDQMSVLAYDRDFRTNALRSTQFSVNRVKSNGTDTPINNQPSSGGSWMNFPRADQTDVHIASPTIRYEVWARDIETGIWNLVSNKNITNTCDQLPTFAFTANCGGIQITGLNDTDRPGQGVAWQVTVFHDGGSSLARTYSGRNNGNTAMLAIPPENGVNGGWRVEARATSLRRVTGIDLPTRVTTQTRNIVPCYRASCTVSFTGNMTGIPGAPANGVLAGSDFNARVTVTNTNPDPTARIPGASVPSFFIAPHAGGGGDSAQWAPISNSSTPTNGSTRVRMNQDLNPGQSMTMTFRLHAPNTVALRPIIIDHLYDGKFWYQTPCTSSPSAAIYQPFAFTPIAGAPNLLPDVENPERIEYSTDLTQASGNAPGYPGATYYTGAVPFGQYLNTLQYRPIATGVFKPNPFNNTNRPASYSGASNAVQDTWVDTILGGQFNHGGTVDTWTAGDQACSSLTIDRATGLIGPSNNILIPTSATTPPNCIRVVNMPYARFYGHDVAAGGAFGAPQLGNGEIFGFTKDATQGAGTAVEFAAYALESVNGFSTAATRTASPPRPAGGLTYANTPAAGGLSGSRAAPDYFNAWRFAEETAIATGSVTKNINTPASDIPDKEQSWYRVSAGSRLTINGGTNYSKRHTIFVEGDVFINSNIEFDTTWADIREIPSFVVVVKGGNIYIGAGVSRLDGIYVAQPRVDGSAGKIFTCANSSGAYAESAIFASCGTQLRVNGIFAAQEVKFLRTYRSLRDIPVTPGPTYAREPAATTSAAEVFQLGPELYLARHIFRSEGSQSNGKYDYLINAPPIL